jgi:hypothetical protein
VNDVSFVKRNEIDDKRWNELITNSVYSLPYGFTWYLDAVAENWDALIAGDYVAVMPMVWLKKLGIKCVYQPYFCQQLGIFSALPLNAALTSSFLDIAKKHFKYIDCNFNYLVAGEAAHYEMQPKKNLVLGLNHPYAQLKKGYSQSHRRNITKATKAGLIFQENVEPAGFSRFYLSTIDRSKQNFKPKHEQIFIKLLNALFAQNCGHIAAAVNDEGHLYSAVLLINHQNRIINIINATSPQGMQTGAAPFMFDKLIQKQAGNALVLDFEGSSFPSIARFYAGFGATVEVFYHFKHVIIKSAGQLFLKKAHLY